MDNLTLLKFLIKVNIGSRRYCFDLIKNGEIAVNDKIIAQPLFIVRENDKVFYSNKQLKVKTVQEDLVYIMMNKPSGVICSVEDQDNKPSILRLIKHKNLSKLHLFPVGRLDYLTEGLIFITNDGEFAHYLTHPKNKIEKHYYVEIKGLITNKEVLQIKKGIYTKEARYKAKDVKIISAHQKISKLRVILDEGKNREIRNIFAILKHKIKTLKRIQIHTLKLDGKLRPGDYKLISKREMAKYFPILKNNNK